MRAKPLRYAPTDARRPDLAAQACGVVAVVRQITSDIEMLGLPLAEHELLDQVVEDLKSAGPERELAALILQSASSIVGGRIEVQTREALDAISDYLPSLGRIEELDDQTAAEALRQAGVPRTRLGTTQNPVGVSIRKVRELEGLWQRFQRLDRGRWWRTLTEEGADGDFKNWAKRWADILGSDRAEGLAWGLTKLESQRHLGLVWKIIHRMSDSYPDHSPQDMFGWGWYGLTQAIRGYDPETAAFSTYAARRINGAIRDGVRAEHHLPKRLTSMVREIQGAEEELVHDLGRAPSLEELSSHVGATLAELELVRGRYQQPASIEELMAGLDEDDAHHDFAPSRDPWDHPAAEDPEEAAVRAVQAEAVQEAVAALPPEEREAVKLLIFEGMTTTEAAELTGLSPRQLRRARERGLEIIAEALKTWAT